MGSIPTGGTMKLSDLTPEQVRSLVWLDDISSLTANLNAAMNTNDENCAKILSELFVKLMKE